MRFSFPLTMAIIALVLAGAAGADDGDGDGRRAQPQESPFCKCWYEGYEDGLEFRWDNRRFAEDFDSCASRGQLAAYELGFQAAGEGGERRCPR